MARTTTTTTVREIVAKPRHPTCITVPSGLDYTPIHVDGEPMLMHNASFYHTPGMGPVAEITGHGPGGRYIHLPSVPLSTVVEVHEFTPDPYYD